MKIIKLAQNKQVAWVMSLDEFVHNLPHLKEAEVNAISIRDSQGASSEINNQKYAQIDAAGLQNLYVETFDDLAEPIEKRPDLVFPQQDHVVNILNWAKQKRQENNKAFVVHCTGGVSRSSAIAMLLNQMFVNDYRAGYDVAIYSPNQKVLEYGEEYLGVDPFRDVVREEERAYDKKKFDEE